LRLADPKPKAVYFGPSSDLFQPAPEVLELTHSLLEFLLSKGVGVAFLTKGVIPDCTLQLLIEHRELVRAQIGLITLGEGISRIFESHAASPDGWLLQLETLIAGGVHAEARLDPILPGVTDSPESLNEYLASLARVGVKRTAAGILFVRPGILYWLKSRVSDRRILALLLHAYQEGEKAAMRGAQYPILNLPTEARREIFDSLERAAAAHSIEIKICACKNADLARGSCNIVGTWPGTPVHPTVPSTCRTCWRCWPRWGWPALGSRRTATARVCHHTGAVAKAAPGLRLGGA
jgi:DNA repair photolyase